MTRPFRSLGTAALSIAVSTLSLAHPARLLAAGPLAQPPDEGHPATPVHVVAAVLQLSPEQVAAWTLIRHAEAEAVQPLAEQIRQRQQAIAALLESGNPDPAVVGQLLIEVHALSRQVQAIRMQAVAQFRQLLIPPQLQRLEQIRQAAPLCTVVPAFVALGLISEGPPSGSVEVPSAAGS